MPAPNSIVKRYSLTGGQNIYSSPASVNENDARKLQSLIPSLAGYLERERPTVPFTADAPFASRIAFFHQFKRNNNGIIVTYQFCATATELYLLTGAFPTQIWQPVLTLQGFPVAVNINNTMHISDGINSWIYDGLGFNIDGLAIPFNPPHFAVIAPVGLTIAASPTGAVRVNGVVTITTTTPHGLFAGQVAVVAAVTDPTFDSIVTILTVPSPTTFTYKLVAPFPDSASGAGTVNATGVTILSNRYYWTTYSDQSLTHPHESSSSPISLGTGPQTNMQFQVFVMPGTLTVALGNAAVVGVGTNFDQRDIGKALWVPGGGRAGIILSVQDAQHLTLAAGSLYSAVGPYNIAPIRATHWNLYASSSEEDKVGNYLASIPINFFYYFDFSPMDGTVGSYFRNVQRPLLNDPPLPSPIMEVYQNRIWRVVPKFPNFFSYTGNEEILAEQAGTPSECVPGDDPNTVSPGQINETSYPDQSSTITSMKAHGAALFIGTELNVIPLYGESLADFQLSNSQAFAVGFAGRKLSVSTPFGLAFVSYDTKVYLYPSQYSFGVDSTTALVELGRPMRPEFENIDGSDYQNASLTFYNWGRRNWLVLNYRRTDLTFATWVFDFETKGWFQLQQGYTAVYVFEMTLGRRSLVAATTDNHIVVIDDRTGNYPIPVNTNYPVGYFHVLLDFGDPNASFIIHSVEYEKSDQNMEVDVTIWLDPINPENPGVGIPVIMSETTLGANTSLGRPNSDTGASCQRMLIEFAVAAGPIAGTLHGFTVEAEKMIVEPVL
jgi:hypothetical protein